MNNKINISRTEIINPPIFLEENTSICSKTLDTSSFIRNISSHINSFESVSLSDIGDASLLERQEKKYLLTEEQAEELLKGLTKKYLILEIENRRICGYETLYFDTRDYGMYLQHHNGKTNRFKVRSRHYESSNQSFFEIKKKTSTGKSLKTRLPTQSLVTTIKPELNTFLDSYFPYDASEFIPQILNTYQRITFVSKNKNERVTFDFNLGFIHEDKQITLPGVVIIEVKIGDREFQSPVQEVLNCMRLHSTSFSKYCTGVSLLCPEVKHNRFIPKIRWLSEVVSLHQEVAG
jgi:hypothetical protein